VEVDNAAPLVFGDLGVGNPDLDGELLVGQPSLAGQGPAQADGEAALEFGGAGVEQDCAGVVVAVRAKWLTELDVVPGVPVWAGQPIAVRAALAAAAGVSAFMKGGSIDAPGFHAVCTPGGLFFDNRWVFFSFTINWPAPAETDPKTVEAFAAAVHQVLQIVISVLS
jgi:hypothetical protein